VDSVDSVTACVTGGCNKYPTSAPPNTSAMSVFNRFATAASGALSVSLA
jgi:hypothetical protein